MTRAGPQQGRHRAQGSARLPAPETPKTRGFGLFPKCLLRAYYAPGPRWVWDGAGDKTSPGPCPHRGDIPMQGGQPRGVNK